MIDYKRICIDELKCHSYKLRSLESLPEEIRRYQRCYTGKGRWLRPGRSFD